MSASPTKASLEAISQPLVLPRASSGGADQPATSGSEALQALLAFSAFHQQIRQRRSQEERNATATATENPWQLEQFVLDEVLQLVAERALAITGADGIAIAMAEADAIVCRASSGVVAPDAGARLDPNSGFSGACLVSGRIVRCDDSETDSRVDAQACRRLGARSMVAVPLSARQRVIGLVEAFSSEPYGFNDSDVRSLSLLAELILGAMRPDEEDRLAEISERVMGDTAMINPPAALETGIKNAAPLSHIPVEPSEPKAPVAGPSPAVFPDEQGLEPARPGLAVVMVVLLLAAGLGVGLWWSMRQRGHPVPASSPHVLPAPVAAPPTPAPSASTAAPSTGNEDLASSSDNSSSHKSSSDGSSSGSPSAHVENAGLLPKVTGIRHWSSADSSTVAIDLEDQVQYEAHRISNPDRIYFDLHDTTLAPELSGKTIGIEDALLRRIRVAQPTPGVTRVVLETKSAADFSVSLEQNPYRLVVEIRKPGTKPQSRTHIDLFGPVPEGSPSAVQAALTVDAGKRTRSAAESNSIGTHGPQLRIALDAGHGGWDLGTVGRQGLLEKDLVLDIVDRLGKLIEDRLGAEVIYTRKDDDYVALEKRAEIANLSRADLFVSVHANYSDYPSARGVETYYTNTYSSVRARTPEADSAGAALQNISWTNVDIREKVRESHRFAASVQRSLYGMLASRNSGIRNRGVKEAQYAVLTGTTMPAILAEVSFVSSPTDETALQSETYRQQIAEALYRGIAHYAQDSERTRIASASAKPGGR
jgi:N-acetylmuramoyl-L-alanine amidase